MENFKGAIYELYCYDKILSRSSDIPIIRSNCVGKKSFGSFSYSKFGKINYHSDEIHLAEFDILGIDAKNEIIHWWEVTKSKHGVSALKTEIKRKKAILRRVLECYKLEFALVTPEPIKEYGEFENVIIPEPDYAEYTKTPYYCIKSSLENCVSLEKLARQSKKYSIVKEIIAESEKFFKGDESNIQKIKDERLIERLYDLGSINAKLFKYYNLAKGCYGIVEVKNGKFYKDGEIIGGRKKTLKEIQLIRKALVSK